MVSNTLSGHEFFFATICISPILSIMVKNEIFPWPLTLETHPIMMTSVPANEGSKLFE